MATNLCILMVLIGPPSFKTEYKMGKNINTKVRYLILNLKLLNVPRAIIIKLNTLKILGPNAIK